MSLRDWLSKSHGVGNRKDVAPSQTTTGTDLLERKVVQVLRTIYDPEIPVNIYDLGLIYDLDVRDSGEVNVRMTLTSPNCPVAQGFPEQVECAVNAIPGVTQASVELVWDPPWSREMMSEAAQLELGLL